MDTTAATEPTTSKQAEALGYKWTDWEVAFDMWVKDMKETRRKTFRTEKAFRDFMEKTENDDRFGGWRGTRRPSMD